MIKLLIYLLIIWALFKLWRLFNTPGGGRVSGPRSSPGAGRIDGGELVQDPQCGVYIPKATAVKGPDGTYFCSEACLQAYKNKEL